MDRPWNRPMKDNGIRAVWAVLSLCPGDCQSLPNFSWNVAFVSLFFLERGWTIQADRSYCLFCMRYSEVHIFKRLKICDSKSRRFLHSGQTLLVYDWMYSQVVSPLRWQAHQPSPSGVFLWSAASLVISLWCRDTLHETVLLKGVCVRVRDWLTCIRLKFSGNRLVRRKDKKC